MSVLRVYLPAECDAAGVPLDWACCRRCDGHGGGVRLDGVAESCLDCGGHGSLKAAALHGAIEPGFDFAHSAGDVVYREARCEGCSHPLSEGTWEPVKFGDWTGNDARFGPGHRMRGRFFSRCDERCEHEPRTHPKSLRLQPPRPDCRFVANNYPALEASWRQVDVRCLSWPHDLRPEMLAVLCTRCWADRKS